MTKAELQKRLDDMTRRVLTADIVEKSTDVGKFEPNGTIGVAALWTIVSTINAMGGHAVLEARRGEGSNPGVLHVVAEYRKSA